MTIVLWAIIALFVLELILFTSKIGKPRKMLTGGEAAASVVEYLVVIAALLWVVLSL